MTDKKPLKIFIVAGEESGDLHGSKLVHAINKHTTSIQFTGHGGDRMANENVQIIEHIDDLACLLYTSPSPRDLSTSRMPSSA